MSLCEYRDVFGAPRQGVHSLRLFDVAVVDVALTLLLAYVVQRVGNFQHYWLVLLCVFIVGIVLHRLFCVDTTIDRLLRRLLWH